MMLLSGSSVSRLSLKQIDAMRLPYTFFHMGIIGVCRYYALCFFFLVSTQITVFLGTASKMRVLISI